MMAIRGADLTILPLSSPSLTLSVQSLSGGRLKGRGVGGIEVQVSAVDYISITSVFDHIARLSLGRLSLSNVFWSLDLDLYIPLTTSLEGN